MHANHGFFVAIAILFGLSVPSAHSAEPAKLDPDAPYQVERVEPVTYDVDFSAVVTPPYHAKVLKVWLPIPQSDAGQEVSDSQISSFPMEVTPRIEREE